MIVSPAPNIPSPLSVIVALFSAMILGSSLINVSVGSSGSPSLSGSTLSVSFGSSLSSVTVVSSGLFPDANTVLVTPPASTSFCVITYVAKYVAVSSTNKIPSALP